MGVYNGFVIQQGADWNETIVWKDSNGNLQNIGWAKMQIRTGYGASSQGIVDSAQSTTVLSVQTNNPGSAYIVQATQGTLSINLLGGVSSLQGTANIPPGYYVYDIIAKPTASSTSVTRLLEGQLYVSPGVTSQV